MNKKIIITSIILGIILIIFVAVLITKPLLPKPNLKFSTSQCNSDIDPYSKPKKGILSQNWKNNKTLIIEGYVKTYCGGAEIDGDYNLEGNNLILKYKIKTGDAVTSCICAHKLIYEISNLKHKDYSISIIPEQKEIIPQSEFSVSYYFTAETTYEKIEINETKLVYTYFKDVNGKCAHWLQQSPCWTQNDLKTEEIELSKNELNELKNLIRETGIMGLNNYYGPEEELRCYPYKLTIFFEGTNKEIIYCSRPDGPEEPEAFRKVSEKITEIVDRKFSI
jgi:hypothetical protein